MESKLQAFQFSIQHRFVVHNARLYKMGLVDSESCNLCARKDTIIHRYWDCRYVSVFWSYFEDWYNKYSPKETVSLSLKKVIFGFYRKIPKNPDKIRKLHVLDLTGFRRV